MSCKTPLFLTLLAAAAFGLAGPRMAAVSPLRDAPSALAALDEVSGLNLAGLTVAVPSAPSAPAAPAAPARPRKGCDKSAAGAQVSKQVQAFLEENGEDFDSYAPSCPVLESCPLDGGYRRHEKVYSVKGDLEQVFRAFTTQAPREAWRGSSRFEMMFDRATGQKYTKLSPQLPAITTRQLFFLTLYLPLGLKIPVVFETVLIDPAAHEFAFSYVKANKSNGIQFIKFAQNGDRVDIRHTTHFRSASDFRDKHLYAAFHERLTDDFYADFFDSLSGGGRERCTL